MLLSSKHEYSSDNGFVLVYRHCSEQGRIVLKFKDMHLNLTVREPQFPLVCKHVFRARIQFS